MVKKRILSIVLAAVFLVSSSGCNNGESSSNSTLSDIQDSVSGDGLSDDLKSEPYLYEQELNVIDDKYRTFYEVFVYSFADSNNDGIGDINGLTQNLDYISDMGFNGIWLMPINPSSTYHKYDVDDYYSIDPAYGTIDDFKNFLNECDKRGIRVIMDLVLNHTSEDNPWFKNAVEAIKNKDFDNQYIDYYHFSEGRPNSGTYYSAGVNNWYYEAMFWSEMPDLNLDNELLRKDLEDVMKYWLDMGIGGFRLDAAKEYFSGKPQKNIEVLKWITDYCRSIKEDVYLVAEVWEGFTEMKEYYQSGIDSLFNFAFSQESGIITRTIKSTALTDSPKQFASKMEMVGEKISEEYEKAIDASFFTNHDTARAAGYFYGDDAKIKMAGAINVLMSGTSFVYYGEEIGMSGSGRDENKRAPFVWSDEGSEFDTKGPTEMETVTHSFSGMKEQLEDENSILNYYKRVIRLRNENPEIARGSVTALDISEDNRICAIKKTYQGSEIYLIYNISEEEKTISLDNTEIKDKLIRGYASSNGRAVTLENNEVYIPPYSIVIFK